MPASFYIMEVGIIRRKKFVRPEKKKLARINEEIRAAEVRLIDAEGAPQGIVALSVAMESSLESGLDLVEVSPKAKPPVCKVMDYGKFRYEMEKKEKEARKNRKIIKLKEIKMTPKIEQHDYDTKMKKIRAFIDEGDRVKITIFFKGRMMAHKDLGHKLLKKIMGELEEVVKVEKPSSMQGRQLTMVVSPIKGK